MRKIGFHALWLTTLAASIALLSRAWFEVYSGALHSDALIFQTVGRGILNGLAPYEGLFETKPPGIFLLHALSLQLFDSQFLVKLLQAITLLGIPVAVLAPTLGIIAKRPAEQRQVLSILTLLFGVCLALFAADQSGLGLTESYGAFALLVALGFLVTTNQNVSGKHLVLISMLLLIAVGLKEPFILTFLAGVMLLLEITTVREFVKSLTRYFVIPVLIAGIIGVIALAILGYIEPFFGVYLPHMLGFHVHQHNTNVLLRALEFWRAFVNLGAFSWSLAAAVTLLCMYTLAMYKKKFSVVLLALYITMLAIAMGGDFYGHHFVFGLPVYAVAYWKVVSKLPQKLPTLPIGVFAGLLMACAALDTQFSYVVEAAAWKQKEQQYKGVAETIDQVMERCDYARYLQVIPRGGGPYAYTKASPYGPIFIHYSRFIGGSPHYQQSYIRALRTTPMLLLYDIEDSNFTEFAKQYVEENFSEQPPACAGADFAQPEPFTLLF